MYFIYIYFPLLYFLFFLHDKCSYVLKYNKYFLISNQKETWKNYAISLVSNIFISLASLINIMNRNNNDLIYLTELDKYIYIFCISYFSYDLYTINFKIKYKNSYEYNLHHTLVLYAIIYTYKYNIYSGYVVWLLTTEISTIFLNIRWFLYKSKYEDNSIESIFSTILFIISYTIFRIIQLPYVEYKFIKNYNNDIASSYYFYKQLLLFTIIYLLNLYWYFKIIQKFYITIINFPKPYSIYE